MKDINALHKLFIQRKIIVNLINYRPCKKSFIVKVDEDFVNFAGHLTKLSQLNE